MRPTDCPMPSSPHVQSPPTDLVAMLASSGEGPNISGNLTSHENVEWPDPPSTERNRMSEVDDVRRMVRTVQQLRRGYRTGYYMMTNEALREFIDLAWRNRIPTEVYDRITDEQVAGVTKLDGRWQWWSEAWLRKGTE